MFFASRSVLRLSRHRKAFSPCSQFSSAAARPDEYHSFDGQLLHEMHHPVAFQGDTAAVFDGTKSKERRFVPWEIKELSFKCSMGIMGA